MSGEDAVIRMPGLCECAARPMKCSSAGECGGETGGAGAASWERLYAQQGCVHWHKKMRAPKRVGQERWKTKMLDREKKGRMGPPVREWKGPAPPRLPDPRKSPVNRRHRPPPAVTRAVTRGEGRDAGRDPRPGEQTARIARRPGLPTQDIKARGGTAPRHGRHAPLAAAAPRCPSP